MGRLVGVSPAGARRSLRRSGCQAGGRRRDLWPMLTWEEELEAEALFKRGWTISAIARHLGRDRKTVRAYLCGQRTPGERRRSSPDPFERYVGYVAQRLADDRHVWASTLFDEVVELGYPGSYPSFTRALRARVLRPS